jgi:hypothetical protein
MWFCLLLAAANTVTLAAITPANLKQQSVVVRLEARVTIIVAETIGPIDRKAKNKGHDRYLRRKGDINLVEFY